MMSTLWRSFKKLFTSCIREVPEESARCAFICNDEKCSATNFKHCIKRKEYLAGKRES